VKVPCQKNCRRRVRDAATRYSAAAAEAVLPHPVLNVRLSPNSRRQVSHGTVDHGTYPQCFGIFKFTTVMDGIPLFVTRYRFTMGVILIVVGGGAAHGPCHLGWEKPTVTRVLQLFKCLKGVLFDDCEILSPLDNIAQNTDCDTPQTLPQTHLADWRRRWKMNAFGYRWKKRLEARTASHRFWLGLHE
jgi:hypothetical protein